MVETAFKIVILSKRRIQEKKKRLWPNSVSPNFTMAYSKDSKILFGIITFDKVKLSTKQTSKNRTD